MSSLNAVLRALFDGLLWPFAGLTPIWSLIPISLLVSIGMLIVFKHTSNQDRLSAVKRQITAGIFEIRLFSDDLPAILRAQFDILRHNLTYLRLTLVPMVYILPPLVLIMAQLQFHYGYQGLRVGQKTLLRVDLGADTAESGKRPAATLDLPAGLRAETESVYIPSQSQLAWRIAAEKEGDYQLGITINGAPRVTKTVRVTSRTVRLSPERVDTGFLSQLLYPAEAPIPSHSPIHAVRLGYQERDVSVLGFGMNWMIPFFALSILFAFALRGVFKVTI